MVDQAVEFNFLWTSYV